MTDTESITDLKDRGAPTPRPASAPYPDAPAPPNLPDSGQDPRGSSKIKPKPKIKQKPRRRMGQDILARRPWNRPQVQRRRRSSPVVIALDAMSVMVATIIAIYNWLGESGEAVEALTALRLGVVALPVWILIFYWQGMYRSPYQSGFSQDLRRVVYAVGLGGMAFILLGWPLGVDVPRGVVVAIVALLIPMLMLERGVLRYLVRKRWRAGDDLEFLAVLGTNSEARQLASALADPTLGRKLIAYISTEDQRQDPIDGIPVVNSDDPAATARELGVGTVAIAATALPGVASTALLRSFLDRGIEVEMTSALTGVSKARVRVQAAGPIPVLSIEPGFRGGWRAVSKRIFDIVGAGLILVVTSPIWILSAVALRLDTPGPILFRQQRVGRRGEEFGLLKLRSMVEDAEDRLPELEKQNISDGPLFKMKGDPRVTRVGRFLRITSIDELPQLWNVIRGDMSLVGPRPALSAETAEFDQDLRNRLRVRPGLTGRWQVHGRGSSDFDQYQLMDLYYIDNWSFLADVSILFRTIPAVLRRRGAF